MKTESKRLVKFSEVVRRSTLDYLKKVPAGKENWRHHPGGMSFSDLVQHLIDADYWLIKMVERGEPHSKEPRPGEKVVRDFQEFQVLLEELERAQILRKKLIEGLSDESLEDDIQDQGSGKKSVWWAIVSDTLDHETHHRGQIEVYLEMLNAK